MNKSFFKCAKRKKPDTKDYIPYDFIYMAIFLYSDRKQNGSPGAGRLVAKRPMEIYGNGNILNLNCGANYMGVYIC